MKTLKDLLIENAKKESGGCWMQDFVPIIQKSVKEWLEQEAKRTQGCGCGDCTAYVKAMSEAGESLQAEIELDERLASKNSKEIKGEPK